MSKLSKNRVEFISEKGVYKVVFKVTTYNKLIEAGYTPKYEVIEKADENGEIHKYEIKYSFKCVGDNGKLIDLHIYDTDLTVFHDYVGKKVKAYFTNYQLNTSYEYPQAFASGLDVSSIIKTF